MREGHPVVWLWTVVAVVAVATQTTNLIGLVWLVVCLAATGLLAGGPRRASFTAALGVSFVTALWWWAATLLLPIGTGPVLLHLPQWRPGPGVSFGGDITVGAAANGLTQALGAISILLVLGLAGQVVGARSWLSLARVLGPIGPAVAPLCCLGEACAEVTGSTRSARRRALGRRGTALPRFLTAVADLSRWCPAPGQDRMPSPRLDDLAHLAAPAALTAVLFLSERLGLHATLNATDLVPPAPWLLLGAALLLPLGVMHRA